MPSPSDEATFSSRLKFMVDAKRAELAHHGRDASQNAIGRLLKIDSGLLSRYISGERGGASMSLKHLKSVVHGLGCDMEWLVGGYGVDGRVWADDPTMAKRMERLERITTDTPRRIRSSPPPASAQQHTSIPSAPKLPSERPRHLHPVGGRKRPTK